MILWTLLPIAATILGLAALRATLRETRWTRRYNQLLDERKARRAEDACWGDRRSAVDLALALWGERLARESGPTYELRIVPPSLLDVAGL